MTRTLHVAVCIPCSNVSRHLAEVVDSLPPLVQTVVLVDDGSVDGTREIVETLEDPRIVRVYHERNQGVGAATLSGYRVAIERGADICVKMDGDGQMAAEDLPALLEPLVRGEADYSKGNRFRDIDALSSMPRVRLLGNGALSFLTKVASGYWSIFDPTNGFTAVWTDILRRLDFRQIRRRFFFETSMLVELNILGAVVRDVDMPARYHDEHSSLRIGATAFKFPILLIHALARRFFWRFVMRDFNALTICVLVGVPATLFGVAFGSYHWWKSLTLGIEATAGTVFVAALPIILGFQCILAAFVLDVVSQPSRPVSGVIGRERTGLLPGL